MEELVDRVRTALAAEYSGAPNGRVRDLPDRRSIRWYSTIGLVDRPLGTRGRTALYGPRHLMQLVAIKRLQAAGRTLAEIQADLSGASDESLTDLARVPSELLEADPSPPPATPRPPFWKSPPAPQTAPTHALDWAFPQSEAPSGLAEVPSPAGDPGTAPPIGADALLTGVPLGSGLILLVPGSFHLDRIDRTQLATAARPLLDLLASRGLTDRRDS
ncbi:MULTISPECIES: MerR family transcriptional regulator [unclassified Actinoplanes]|uniref:helix-turn-helix domain-containing protein n=1 Tax=unclassified Actinoplanes TaxID=2626549 RepID=UPI001E4502F6|nr:MULTISPECIES: MerR family transcriptional regulator [unclassified Actinoplanes]